MVKKVCSKSVIIFTNKNKQLHSKNDVPCLQSDIFYWNQYNINHRLNNLPTFIDIKNKIYNFKLHNRFYKYIGYSIFNHNKKLNNFIHGTCIKNIIGKVIL